MLEQIKEILQGGGVSVQDSVEGIDECLAPCVVVCDRGTEAQAGAKGLLGRHACEVICLAPITDTAGPHALEKQVRQLLRQLPGLRFVSSSTTGAEQTLKARTQVMTYTFCERL